MTFEKLPVTVLIMCQNEESNISYALDSVVPFFEQVVVTDSFSVDQTAQIVRGYSEVEFFEHKFEGWADQRNWMLEHCLIRNPIVFFLDADEVVSFDFVKELRDKLKMEFDAIQMVFDMYFLKKHIKYSYGHPVVKRIFKFGSIFFKGEGAREYSNYHDIVLTMHEHVRHEDHKGVSFWIDKHNKNAEREADLYCGRSSISQMNEDIELDFKQKVKLFIRSAIWDKLPLMVRPFLYFVYRYFLKRGFLDGRVGFIFCFLHALWYQSLIDIKIIERKS